MLTYTEGHIHFKGFYKYDNKIGIFLVKVVKHVKIGAVSLLKGYYLSKLQPVTSINKYKTPKYI